MLRDVLHWRIGTMIRVDAGKLGMAFRNEYNRGWKQGSLAGFVAASVLCLIVFGVAEWWPR